MTLLSATMLDDLAHGIEGDVLADDLARAMYATAAGVYQILPLAIVRPQGREDIIRALRWAAANGVPLTMRGGGTSPADASLGPGIVVDTTTYMGRETEIDVHDETVIAPPGVAYAAINDALASFGRYLPPGPPGGETRTIGGMIATNASGINSVRYGSIIEYVESLELVLADGSVIETGMHDVRQNAFKEFIADDTAGARITKSVYDLLRDNRGLVRSKTPKLLTNSSGYQLARTLGHGHMDLGQLLTGSEGTLAVITKATLRTIEQRPMTGMLLFYFDSVQLAADSVRPILDAEPRSVELIDARSLELVKSNRPDLAHFLRDGAESVLIVEFEGEDNDELIPKLLETQRLIAEEGGTANDSILATADPDMDEARALRAAALNVLHNIREPRRLTPFIEDIAVEPDMVSSCVHGLSEVMKKRGLDATLNGHIGHGNVSARPLLDLKSPDDIRVMREVAEDVFEMVVEMGGTISSANGDGRPRTEFLRLQYDTLCDVFAEVKRLFDPAGVLNPGIKVGGERGTIISNLRYGPDYERRHVEPKLQYSGEPREDVIEKCHGCGACRSLTDLVAMCPVYKALQAEEASPRAKANILRHLLSSQGGLPPEEEVVAEMTRLTDLCVNCKMCSVECPAGIDVAKLMVELRSRRAEKNGLAWDEKVAKRWNTILSLLATFPTVGDFLARNRAVRFLAEKAFGIAARRQLPRFRVLELSGRHKPTLTKVRDRVVCVTDPYVDCCSPEISQCTRRSDPQCGRGRDRRRREHGRDAAHVRRHRRRAEAHREEREAAGAARGRRLPRRLHEPAIDAVLPEGHARLRGHVGRAGGGRRVVRPDAVSAEPPSRRPARHAVPRGPGPARVFRTVPSAGAPDRQAVARSAPADPRTARRQPRRRVLRHGRHLRIAEEELRSVDEDRTPAVRYAPPPGSPLRRDRVRLVRGASGAGVGQADPPSGADPAPRLRPARAGHAILVGHFPMN